MSQWESERLGENEHPDELYARLVDIKRKLSKIGQKIDDKNLTRRFISAIETNGSKAYKDAIAYYRGKTIEKKPCPDRDLREYLDILYQSRKEHGKEQNTGMKGFLTISKCDYCKKQGHNIKECWIKDPSKRNQNKQRQSVSNRKGKQEITCWGCNKQGHYEKQCWVKHPELKQERDKKPGIAAAAFDSNPAESKPIYLDSACSCHLIASLNSFDQRTLKKANTTLVAVGGQKMNLTYVGATRIETANGPITLTNAYYAEGLEYSLISAPELIKQGVRVCLDKNQAYIQK